MVIKTPKICRGCAHFRPDATCIDLYSRLTLGVCVHPRTATLDVVTGQRAFDLAARVRGAEGCCGPHGLLHEPVDNRVAQWARERAWSEALPLVPVIAALVFAELVKWLSPEK